ncbi:MAG: GGDEF domain-containing phosphodiesterase [Pseudomonadota bacterium]
MMRHRLADMLTGPFALAILPITLLVWNAMGAQIGLLIGLIGLPTIAVLAALADRHQRQRTITSDFQRFADSRESFDLALRSALYHARLRKISVLCMVIELKAQARENAADHAVRAGWTNDNAMLIKSFLRRRDRVCILGRNRYGVVLHAGPEATEDDALSMARRLKLDIEQGSTYRSGQGDGMLDAVMGVCMSAGTGLVDAKDMIQTANSAVQEARGAYAADIQLKSPIRTDADKRIGTLQQDIGPALESGEFCAWFQPQICAKTNQVTGFEALARWIHPTEGMIPPAKFLPILQRRGMMPLLQERMLHEALRGFEAWRDILDNPPAVGINLSPEDLLDPTLPNRIEWELDLRNIEPRFLNVEILETVVARTDDDVTNNNIERLSAIGCRVDLDDFGTGHASISSLRQFALNRLKIDRSFVSGMEDNPDQENMISAILTMAKQLDLDTLAEGVETEAQQARLSQLGCGHLQGYAIARPMPLEDALEWLATRQTGTDLSNKGHAKVG